MKRITIIICLFIVGNFNLNAQIVRGLNVVGPFDKTLNENSIASFKAMSVGYICLLPEVILNRQSLELENEGTPWTLSMDDSREFIRACKAANINVILKPHLVLGKQKLDGDKIKKSSSWRGNIAVDSEEDWKLIEQNYEAYIISWAQLAEEEGVDAFFIGTELKSFVKTRPQFWENLIPKVKEAYSEAISYSANWDNYNKIKFWESLDFIGVNGYFPISKEKTPSTRLAKAEWGVITTDLQSISKATGRMVFITEFGYRNIQFGGAKPWLHVSQTKNPTLDNQAQYNLLQGFFESIWRADFIIGGLLWNWNQKTPKADNLDFTIQNKPAEDLVKYWFSKE